MEEQKINSQQLQDLIKKMPPKTQGAYYAVSTAESIYEARQASGIPDRLASKIAAKIADVMLGLLNPEKFTYELMNFGIPEVAAANFYRIISQSIFLKIKDELAEIYNPKSVSSEKPVAPTSSLSPDSRQTRPEPRQTRQEPLIESPRQQEESITRIKVEPPPLRHVNVHHFEEEQEKAAAIPAVPATSQPKINDPYREPIDEA